MISDTNPEASRVRALRSLQLLDTEADAAYDDIARFAASVCEAPIAVINFIDESRAWAKAGVGFACGVSTERAHSICSHAIAQPEAVFEIPDLRDDPRFAENPYVAGEPQMRWYAGAPLIVGGAAIGTLCVIDTVPRHLTEEQRANLISAARTVVTLIEYRESATALIRTERHRLRAEQEAEIFTAAVTHGRDGVLVLGASGARASEARVIFANKAYCELTGTHARDVAGQPLRDFTTDPATLDAIDRVCEQGANGTFAPIMFTLRTPEGVERIAEVAVITLPIENIHAGYVIILRDGIDRKKAEETMLAMRAAVAEHEALKRSEERFRNLFARTPAITYTVDRDLVVQSSLGGGLAKFGLAADQTVGWHLSGFYPPEKAAASLAHHQRALRGESVTYESYLFGRKLLVFLEPLWTAERSVEGVSAILFDLTDVAAAEHALAQKEALVERAERFAQTGSWTHEIATGRIAYSGESQRIFGLLPEQSEREAYYARVVPEDRERVRAHMRDAYASLAEITFDYQIDVDGSQKFVRESVEMRHDASGAAVRADGIIVDITEQRLAEIESERVSQTDDVTGLPNRAALRRFINRNAETPGRVAALLAVHFTRFRSINDAYGRAFGDRVLRVAGDRLSAFFPDSYVVRLENATYGVVLADDRDPADVAARIHEHFGAPLDVDGYHVAPTIGIGIALAVGDELADSLAGKAELAARSADSTGGSHTTTFDSELAARTSRRATLDRDLREVLESDQLTLAYQPIVNAREEIVTVEALLRWKHPTFGNVPPDEFIAIAEANGAIVSIGRWVIQTACADLARIERATGRPINVAINVSAKQFSDPDLIDVITGALATAGLEPGRLEIEVTESTIAANPLHAGSLLRDLRAAGTRVSIDDFGTGYSSLSSLRKLPIDVLKIDRSFVMTTPGDSEACAIVEVILGLANTLGLDVIAEGVETAQQAHYLFTRGCTFVQGYHYARPTTPEAIVELISAYRNVAVALRRVRS
jgi:diguanylate cyclase (GGDEF)-like protein/PAS domain S-box-containing protein